MPTIGVFDSGIGGLTVLAALRRRLPGADYIYLGDTARLPYGTKSAETVRRYALQAAGALEARDIDVLVIACNTASAFALDALRDAWPALPVVGVVLPGAQAAVEATRGGPIGVIGTESTIAGGAYPRAIARLNPAVEVWTRACSVFVALAEEGWHDGPTAEVAARTYLDQWFGKSGEGAVPDTLVLGCTHFPLLVPVISKVAGEGVRLVDSATTTAEAVADVLGATAAEGIGDLRLLATDGAQRFATVGTRFLGEPLSARQVEIIDL